MAFGPIGQGLAPLKNVSSHTLKSESCDIFCPVKGAPLNLWASFPFLEGFFFDFEGTIDEEHAVQVVYFVLDNAGVAVMEFERGLGPAEAFITNREVGGTGDFSPHTWEAQTAFLVVFRFI